MTSVDGAAGQVVRATGADRPQHLLLTLLGDYWYPRFDGVPSTALVELLGEFGVSESNARAALSRLARRDLLVVHREGRRTVYTLTGNGMRTLHEGTRRIFTFGAGAAAWDGRWTIVAFSIPEDNRSVRSTLRIRLGWEGFASLFDAVWVAPGDRERAATDLLAELGVTTAMVVVGNASTSIPGGNPIRAWDLDEMRSRYEEFIAAFSPVAADVRAGGLTGGDALLVRTAVIDAWRSFPGVDPELPAELLPPDWPQQRARALFVEIYDALGPPATARVRELLRAHDPERAQYAMHHTSLDALELAAS